MSTLKKFNIAGEDIGEETIEASLLDVQVNPQVIKEYIVAILKNKRQWSASTKTRSERKHTTKKPHPQKGTGRARQGSLVATQFRGGGRPHGPKPKFDQHIKINRKERQKAIVSMFCDKIKANKVLILDSTKMDTPKTKVVSQFLAKLSLDRGVLFLGDIEAKKANQDVNFRKSVHNIPHASFCMLENVNAYDLAKGHALVLTDHAFEILKSWLEGKAA